MRAWLCCVVLGGCHWAFGIGDVSPDAFVEPPPPGRWASIAGGANHLCAIDVDHRLFCWGDEGHGKLAGPGTGVQLPQRVGTAAWNAVAAGNDHTCALSDSGVPWCWGLDNLGQVSGTPGPDVVAPQLAALPVTAPAAFDEITVGSQHSCARAGDAIYCWGNPNAAQGVATGGFAPAPVPGGPWRAVSAGWVHTCAVDAVGGVWCWGGNNVGQVATQNPGVLAPTALGIPGVALRVSAGVARSCAVIAPDAQATTGAIWCWGGGSVAPFPGPAVEVRGTEWTDVVVGNSIVCGLHTGGATCWGISQAGGFGDGVWAEAIPPTGASTVIPADAVAIGLGIDGEENVCVRQAGDVRCWGDNRGGQLGAPRSYHPTPIVVAASTTWTSLAVGASHTCATDATHGVWCWGADDAGQVTRTPSATDQPVPVAEPFTTLEVKGEGRRMVAGLDFTCAHGDGGIDCWGTNADGQLGASDGALHANHVFDATSQGLIGGGHGACRMGPLACWGRINGAQVRTPSAITEDLTNVLDMTYDISFGDQASCAIAKDHRVCWGYGYHGQLGDGVDAGSGSGPVAPRQFTDDSYTAISIIGQHACATTMGATMKCWGTDYSFESGQQVPNQQVLLTPTSIVMPGAINLSGCMAVAAGGAFSCGLCTSTPWCWGANTSGELGRGPDASRLDGIAQPAAMPAGNTWRELGAGGTHACALSTTGTLACWGLGVRGQLGDGGHGSSVPVAIGTPP